MADDLRLPFLFIPHGVPEPPEVAAFKARCPGWFSIPATFVPRTEPDRGDDAVPPRGRPDAPDPPFREAVSPAPHARRFDEQASMAASVRAFQRASEVHGDSVAALRALKENPNAFADPSPASTQAKTIHITRDAMSPAGEACAEISAEVGLAPQERRAGFRPTPPGMGRVADGPFTRLGR